MQAEVPVWPGSVPDYFCRKVPTHKTLFSAGALVKSLAAGLREIASTWCILNSKTRL